jgi:FAD:protein FMN transferase
MMPAMPNSRTFVGLRAAAVIVLMATLAVACDRAPYEYRFNGRTMGTSYQVVAFCDTRVPDIETHVASLLADVNDQMSTYLAESELSHFNAAPVGEWVPVSPALAEVVSAALTLSRASGGAFDVTVGPLVNVWGFGPDRAPEQAPSAELLAAVRERVGYQHLDVRDDPPALRRRRDSYVDLSAIAKGYGVDQVGDALEAWGCARNLVDIGGDLRAGMPKPGGEPWRIGVEVPDRATRGSLQRVLMLDGISVATSGDYRNFADWDGEPAHHIIDPRTGYPAASALRSVTVLHPSAMWSDGYATLLQVLGPDEGYRFALDNELPVLLIVQTNGAFEERMTPQLEPYLAD